MEAWMINQIKVKKKNSTLWLFNSVKYDVVYLSLITYTKQTIQACFNQVVLLKLIDYLNTFKVE